MAKLKIGLEYHLEHIIDWSVIWHNFDVVYRTAKKEERRLDTVRWSERNETRRIRETNETPAKRTSWSSPIRLEPERYLGTSRRPPGRSPFARQGTQSVVETKRNAKVTRNERLPPGETSPLIRQEIFRDTLGSSRRPPGRSPFARTSGAKSEGTKRNAKGHAKRTNRPPFAVGHLEICACRYQCEKPYSGFASLFGIIYCPKA